MQLWFNRQLHVFPKRTCSVRSTDFTKPCHTLRHVPFGFLHRIVLGELYNINYQCKKKSAHCHVSVSLQLAFAEDSTELKLCTCSFKNRIANPTKPQKLFQPTVQPQKYEASTCSATLLIISSPMASWSLSVSESGEQVNSAVAQSKHALSSGAHAWDHGMLACTNSPSFLKQLNLVLNMYTLKVKDYVCIYGSVWVFRCPKKELPFTLVGQNSLWTPRVYTYWNHSHGHIVFGTKRGCQPWNGTSRWSFFSV